jgi:hypothetical protein
MSSLLEQKSDKTKKLVVLEKYSRLLGATEDGSWANTVDGVRHSFSDGDFFIPQFLDFERAKKTLQWGVEDSAEWEPRFKRDEQLRGSNFNVWGLNTGLRTDYRLALYELVQRRVLELRQQLVILDEAILLTNSQETEQKSARTSEEKPSSTSPISTSQQETPASNNHQAEDENPNSDTSSEGTIESSDCSESSHSSGASEDEQEPSRPDLAPLFNELTRLYDTLEESFELIKVELNQSPSNKERLRQLQQSFQEQETCFHKTCLAITSESNRPTVEELQRLRSAQEQLLGLIQTKEKTEQSIRIQVVSPTSSFFKQQASPSGLKISHQDSRNEAGSQVSNEGDDDKPTHFETLSKYVAPSGLLLSYLEQRNTTYYWRDFFSSYVAFFVGGCIRYKTEKENRESYIRETLIPAIREVLQSDTENRAEKVLHLRESLSEGISRFSPRVRAGAPEYDNSLQSLLRALHSELYENDQEAEEEFHDQYVIPGQRRYGTS